MGGMWVFPGGTLTVTDQSDDARRLVIDPDRCAFDLRDLTGATLPQRTCVALAIAACRETYEEAGILLARRTDGLPVRAEQLTRLQAKREQLTAQPTLFVAALIEEELVLDFSSLIYWAHWITPAGLTRRFDTRFFAVRAPETQALAADTYETSECLWMSPSKLLDSAARGEMTIAQPTRYTLEDLRLNIDKHRTLDALMNGESDRRVAPIMPKLIREHDTTTIVMPWDASYDAIAAEGVLPGQAYEPALLRLPSRVERDH